MNFEKIDKIVDKSIIEAKMSLRYAIRSNWEVKMTLRLFQQHGVLLHQFFSFAQVQREFIQEGIYEL